jgi:hypothetical protein
MYSFLFDWTKIEFEILLKWALGFEIYFLKLKSKKFKFLMFLFSLVFLNFFFSFLALTSCLEEEEMKMEEKMKGEVVW